MTRRDQIMQQIRYEISGTVAAKLAFTNGMSAVIGGLTDSERADFFETMNTALVNAILALADEIDALEARLSADR